MAAGRGKPIGTRWRLCRRRSITVVTVWALLTGILVSIVSAPASGATGDIATVAGGGTDSADDVLATSALLSQPVGLALDGAGNAYYFDSTATTIRRIDAATGLVSTYAGGGTDMSDGVAATSALLSWVLGLDVDSAGNLYVADAYNATVRRIDAATGVITTVAGSHDFPGLLNTLPDPVVSLGSPESVAVGSAGDLWVVDNNGNFNGFGGLIHRDAATGMWDLVLSNSCPAVDAPNGDGGLVSAANACWLGSVAVDAAGNVFADDIRGDASRSVRRIDAVTGIITTVVGGGIGDGSSGVATDLALNPSSGDRDIALDDTGHLYVANASRLWRVDLATGALDRLAGDGTWALSGDGGPATLAQFSWSVGIAVAPNGDLWFDDSGNDRIRRIEGVTAPATGDVVVDAGTAQAFLDSLTTITGNLVLQGVAGRTDLILPNLTSVGGSIVIADNPDLTTVSLPSLTDVGGGVSLTNNPNLVTVDLGTSNPGILTIQTGDLTVVNTGPIGTINTADLTIQTGDLTIVNTGTIGTINTADLTIQTGDLTVVNTGIIDTINTGSTSVTGDMTVTTGQTSISANTAGGTTSVTLVDAVTMAAVLPTGTFVAPVPFTITALDPASLAPSIGTDPDGTPTTVDPLASYQFVFGVPTLNADATLTFDVALDALAPTDRDAFLAAVAGGTATLAVRGDTPGSVDQTLAVCPSTTTTLTAGGCIRVEALDADGVAVADPATAATIRLTGVTGHFSTWSVVIATPVPTDQTAPVLTGVPAAIDAAATGPDGATVTYTAPTATDDVDGPVPVACTPAPGSTFPLGTTTVTCVAADTAGNTATGSFTVTVTDATVPTAQAAITAGVAGVAGWYRSAITVTVTGADPASGIESLTYALSGAQTSAAATVTGDHVDISVTAQGDTTVTYTARDRAGNQSAPQTLTVRIDSVAPTITITTPAQHAVYDLDTAVSAAYSCDDTGSGVGSCDGTLPNGASLDTSTVGGAQFSVTATDQAGNTATLNHTYTVRDTALVDRFDLKLIGGLELHTTGALDDGGYTIERDPLAITSVNGTGRVGDTSLSITLQRIGTYPLYGGIAAITDPSFKGTLYLLVNSRSVQPVGDTAVHLKATGLYITGWTWRIVYLDLTIDDLAP